MLYANLLWNQFQNHTEDHSLIEASQFKFPKYSQILYVSVILPFTSTKIVRQVSTSAGLLPRRYPEIRGINARSYFMTHFHFEALLRHCYSTRSTRIKHLPAPHANRLGFWKYWADTGSLLFAVSPGRSRSRMQHDATLSQFSPVPRWGRRGRKSFPFKHIWGVLTVAYWTSSLSWHVMTLEGSQWFERQYLMIYDLYHQQCSRTHVKQANFVSALCAHLVSCGYEAGDRFISFKHF